MLQEMAEIAPLWLLSSKDGDLDMLPETVGRFNQGRGIVVGRESPGSARDVGLNRTVSKRERETPLFNIKSNLQV